MSSLLRYLATRLTRSRLAARACFGGSFSRLRADEHYFDVTTLALRSVLRRGIAPGSRVLDMGTGSAAVLGLWLWRRLRCRVTCSDVNPELVLAARESIRRSGAPIEVLQASFFEGLEDRFDHVVFNPPYVATRVGRERGLPQRTRSQWDGGEQGTRAIEGFLASFEQDGGGAVAWIGVNCRHVPRAAVQRLCSAHAGIELRDVRSARWLPVDVYCLVRRKLPIASASSPDE